MAKTCGLAKTCGCPFFCEGSVDFKEGVEVAVCTTCGATVHDTTHEGRLEIRIRPALKKKR